MGFPVGYVADWPCFIALRGSLQRPAKNVKSSKINQIYRTIEETFPRKDSSQLLARKVDDTDRDWFAEALSKSAIQNGFSWLLSPEPQSFFKPILTVDEILCSPEVLRASEAIQVVLTKMLITPQQAIAVEEITHGQHKDPLWSSYRKGRLTSSKFGLILKPCLAGRAVCNSTMKHLLGNDNLSSVRSIQWGIQHEATAIKAYTEHTIGILFLHLAHGYIRQEALGDLPMALYR